MLDGRPGPRRRLDADSSLGATTSNPRAIVTSRLRTRARSMSFTSAGRPSPSRGRTSRPGPIPIAAAQPKSESGGEGSLGHAGVGGRMGRGLGPHRDPDPNG